MGGQRQRESVCVLKPLSPTWTPVSGRLCGRYSETLMDTGETRGGQRDKETE